MAEIGLDDAKRRAEIAFQERVSNFHEWELAETRQGTFHTRRGNYQGWFVLFRRRPDPGEEKDWRTTLGIELFVNAASGAAELIR